MLPPLLDLNDIRTQNPKVANQLKQDEKYRIFEVVHY